MQGKAARQRRLAGAGEKPPLDVEGEDGLSRSPSEKVRGARGMADQQPGRVLSGRATTFKSRRRGGDRRPPYDRVERDYGEFRRTAARMLRGLDDGRRADAARHARCGYRPCPIFRINLTQRVPYARFKKSLESANVETISSATGRSGYWVVAGGEGHAGRLDRQIERRAALRDPTFVDAIASFGESDPSKKLGPSLERHPIDGGFVLVLDRPLWAGTDDRSRRAARKITAGSRATGTRGALAAGPGASPHPPTKPASGGPVPAAGRGCGRDSALAPAIGPQAMCRRAPPPEPLAGARSHPVSGPHPLGAGVPCRAGDCAR